VNVDNPAAVVQLSVRLVAAPARVDDIFRTLLRVVMLPAPQLPGCHFAQVYQRIDEPHRIDYVEEWDDLVALRRHLSCERFSRLLELVEMAAEAPEVEFCYISVVHGIEYVATQRAMLAGGNAQPGDH
jgi:quinol monooxygenase YgiN